MNKYSLTNIETDEDLEEYLQLMRTIFGENDGVDVMVKRLLENYPGFNWKSIFVVKHESKIIASLNIIPQTWSIGGIPLKAAEMGMVATLSEYRKQGFQRILNKEYEKRLREEGYIISVIEGIPYFYRQFGYEYTIPLDVETRIPTNKIPNYNQSLKIRIFKEEDLPRATELLQETQKKYLVHSIRQDEIWAVQCRTGWQGDWPFEGYLAEEKGVITAYFRLSKKEGNLYLIEVSETDQDTAESILGFLKAYAWDRGLAELVSRVSHNEPFTQTLTSIGGERNKPYAWQVKVIDHLRLFEKLAPLFERRLASSPYRRLTDKVKFNLYRRCISLDILEGKIKEVSPCDGLRCDEIRINHEVFSQLLLGSRSVNELLEIYRDVSIKPRYTMLVDVLFPKGVSFIHPLY